MNSEWPTQNAEIPKCQNEEAHPIESAENLEQELSPEQIDRIMSKVQDIFKYGTAFSKIVMIDNEHSETFGEILRNGILGLDFLSPKGVLDGTFSIDTSIEKAWAKMAREKKNAPVFFNIVGRMDTDKYIKRNDNKTELVWGGPIKMSAYMWNKPGSLAIIFDISNFKEIDPMWRSDKSPMRTHSYAADKCAIIENSSLEIKPDNPLADDIANTADAPRVDSQHGFMAHHRVAPRNFKGLIIESQDAPFNLKKYTDWVVTNELNEYKEKPEKLLPIYDSTGSLLWPKKMNYEEVRKFVNERDTKNINKEEK